MFPREFQAPDVRTLDDFAPSIVNQPGKQYLRLDRVSQANPFIYKCALCRRWEVFKTLSSKLSREITGNHDVYFCFNGQNITAGRELFNFDYWVFKKG